MRNNTRGIIEGAITNGIFIIFLMASIYIPLLSIMAIFLPIPFVVYAKRQPLKWVLITSIVAFILSFLIGNLSGVLMALSSVIPGIVMGMAYRKDFPPSKVIVAGTLANLFFNLFLFWMAKLLLHVNILDQFLQAMDDANQMVQANLDGMLKSLPPEQNTAQNIQQINDMKQSIAQQTMAMKNMFVTIFPSLFVLWSSVQALITHALSRQVLKRLGVHIAGLPQLKDLRFPRWILYYYSIALIIFLYPDITNYPFLHKVAANGTFLLSCILLIQGLAAVFRYGMKRGWNKSVLIIGIILLFLSSLYFILVIIGIIELLFQFIKNRFSEK